MVQERRALVGWQADLPEAAQRRNSRSSRRSSDYLPGPGAPSRRHGWGRDAGLVGLPHSRIHRRTARIQAQVQVHSPLMPLRAAPRDTQATQPARRSEADSLELRSSNTARPSPTRAPPQPSTTRPVAQVSVSTDARFGRCSYQRVRWHVGSRGAPQRPVAGLLGRTRWRRPSSKPLA